MRVERSKADHGLLHGVNQQGQFPACPTCVFIGATSNMNPVPLSEEYYGQRVFAGVSSQHDT